MSSKNLTTRSSQKASSGMSRRDLLKNLMAGVAGAALMPMASRGAPIRGLQGDDGPEVLWDVQAFNPASFQPADLPAYVGGSIVLTMEDQSNFQGALFWLDIQSQQIRGPVEFPRFLYTPVPVNGVLYAGDSEGPGLYALDPNSGAPLWPNPAPYRLAADVAFINGQLVFPTKDGQIVALDTSGNLLWSYSIGYAVGDNQTSSATFMDGAVIVAFAQNVFAVDANSGALLWKFSASDDVLGDLAVSSNGIHFCTADNKVWCLQSNGTLGWSWPNPNNPLNATPGAPVVSGNMIYVADSVGEFFAINPADGSLAWRISLNTKGASGSPIFVEDGVAYISASAGSISDSKLFAVDLTTQGARVISLDLQSYGVFIGVENGIAYYTHNDQRNIAAADFADQFHQFFAESQLMVEDYTTSSNANGYAGNTTSYRTHIQLLDANYNPRANKSVKVWASDNATLVDNGVTTAIGPGTNQFAWVQTDPLGEMSLVVEATDLTCPAIYLWGNFMDAGEALVVYPDNDSLLQLSKTTGTSLQNATDYEGNNLLSDPSSADALASTITNAMAGGPPQNTLSLRGTLQTGPRLRRRGRKPILGSTGDTYIAYPGQIPNLWYFPNSSASTNRNYGTPALQNWEATFDATGIHFTPTASASLGVGQGVGLSFGDLIHNVVHGAENVAKIAYQTVKNVVNVIVTTAENTYNIVVTAVEHAAAIVAAALKTAIGDIKRAIQWLSYLFDWSAILETKEQIKTSLSDNLTAWKSWLQAQQADNFKGLHGGLQSTNVASSLASGQQYTSGSIQSQQNNKNDPQTLYGMGGAKSYNQSRFLTTKVQSNAPAAQLSVSASALGSSSDTFIAAVENFFTTVSHTVTSSSSFQSLPTDIQNTFQNFANLFTDPSKFASNSLSDITKLIQDIAGTLVALADAIVEALVQLLITVVDLITNLLNVPIQIPFVSDLYQLIAKDPLTVLDLCALMAAIPVHIISAAFSEGSSKGGSVGAIPTPQKITWFVFCGLQTVFMTFGDVFGFRPFTPVGRIINCINFGALLSGFPAGFATNTDFTYIFYSIRGIAPLLGMFNSLGATSTIATTMRTIAPYIACAQGIANLAMSVVFAVLGNSAFIGYEYMQMAVNGIQSLPFLSKPLANGMAGSDERLALGVIDGLSFSTALGIAVAQQLLT